MSAGLVERSAGEVYRVLAGVRGGQDSNGKLNTKVALRLKGDAQALRRTLSRQKNKTPATYPKMLRSGLPPVEPVEDDDGVPGSPNNEQRPPGGGVAPRCTMRVHSDLP